MIIVVVEMTFRPGIEEQALRVLGEALVESRASEGCLGIDVQIQADDRTRWLLYERWESLEAAEAYARFRAGPGRIEGLAELVMGPSVKTVYEPSPI